MDGVFFIGGIVLFILVGPWVLVWRTSISRRREREEDQERSRRFESRISALELSVQKLRTEQPVPPIDAATAKPSERPVAAVHTPSIPTPSTTAPPPRSVEPTSSVRVAENWVTQKTAVTPAYRSASTTDRDGAADPATPPQPSFSTLESQPSITDRVRSSLDIEEMLGTNWLNKLGIVILVLGVAFFLAYQLKTLGPAGKFWSGSLPLA
jgi:uncharacterized membrane protein